MKIKFFLFKDYENRIASLQEQVEKQSMISSMYSSIHPEDFEEEEEEGETAKVGIKSSGFDVFLIGLGRNEGTT